MQHPTTTDVVDYSPESAGDGADYPGEPHLLTTATDLQPQHITPDSCSPDLVPGFSSLRAPPSLYPPPSLLPPLGYYNTTSTYGVGIGSTSTYTHTSWSTYQTPCNQFNGVSQPFSAPYSTYPPLFGGSYGALPPPPLHHPEPVDSTISTFPFTEGRKRSRVDDEVDSNLPAKSCRPTVASLELPTPPDSSSDRSGTVSPQNYYHQHDMLPLPSAVPAPSAGLSPPISFPAPPMPQNGVHVSLTPKTEELWNLFYSANTEMIVTKNGRCLFPLLMFNVSGLTRKKEYDISIRAVCSNRYRYKYLHSTWTQVSESEFTHDPRKMTTSHPNSPQTGAKWMAKDVDFKSLKITHYPKSKGGDILLNTMHKYYFELVIEEHRQSDSEPLVFPFHLTNFIAVTAYQSAKLTELKKEKNPFARGVKHHESETDAHPPHPVPSRSAYDHGLAGYMSSCNPGYSYPTSTTVPVPYPTPWTQNGQR